MSLRKVVDCVRRHKKFLITTHANPEGDALGSELAFYGLLRKMGKGAVIINEDPVPAEYAFLPGIQNIQLYREDLRDIKFDCFVILDCSDLDRCKRVCRLYAKDSPALNIDHHISNRGFGTVNWVEPHASSCSEMVFKLYKGLHVPFDKTTALLLYVGIFTDTGSFRYSNTTYFTHKMASELLKFNLDVNKLYNNVYGNIPISDIRLLLKILPMLKIEPGGRIAWFQIKQEMLRNKKLSFDLSENLLSFARLIKDIEAVALFKENLGVKDEIRVNLRSQGKVDVNEVAKFFGGGGHKTASGATIKGKLEDVRKMVLAEIRKALSQL